MMQCKTCKHLLKHHTLVEVNLTGKIRKVRGECKKEGCYCEGNVAVLSGFFD